MFTRKVHSIVAILMMALLITAKLAAYHTLSHEDECVECCSFCESAMLLGQTPAILAEAGGNDLPVLIVPVRENGILTEGSLFVKEIPVSALFSRPPPAL